MLATGKNKSIKSHDMTSTVVKIQSWQSKIINKVGTAEAKAG